MERFRHAPRSSELDEHLARVRSITPWCELELRAGFDKGAELGEAVHVGEWPLPRDVCEVPLKLWFELSERNDGTRLERIPQKLDYESTEPIRPRRERFACWVRSHRRIWNRRCLVRMHRRRKRLRVERGSRRRVRRSWRRFHLSSTMA